jgi:hypothetical protein
MDKRSGLKSIIASLLFAIPAANAAVLDFEDFGIVDFEHGTVVSTQYSPLVTISADNFTNDVDMAVVFDSNESPTNDDDLEAPFFLTQADKDAGLNPFHPGNILIIQENDTGCAADGICDEPDDEGTRFTNASTGVITFEFSQAIELLSLDFFDVENLENGSGDKNRIDVWDFDTNAVTKVGNTPDTGGDNLWQQILFDSSTDPALRNVGRIDVYFAGSGALDNLAYKVVPVPAAVWLFGTALLGFTGFSRRTSV